MLRNTKPVQRATVTVEDRRAILVIASARKPADVAQVPHEAFVRNALKDRMGWPRREPASQSIKDAAKFIASQLTQRDIKAAEARKAAREKAEKEEAERKAKQEADEKRWAEMSLKEHLAEMGADETTLAQVKN